MLPPVRPPVLSPPVTVTKLLLPQRAEASVASSHGASRMPSSCKHVWSRTRSVVSVQEQGRHHRCGLARGRRSPGFAAVKVVSTDTISAAICSPRRSQSRNGKLMQICGGCTVRSLPRDIHRSGRNCYSARPMNGGAATRTAAASRLLEITLFVSLRKDFRK